MTPHELKAALIRKARKLGFLDVRMARAEKMEAEAVRLQEWLQKGYHGEMEYMENHFEKRTDPTLLVPGARTVICLAFNYYTEADQEDPDAPRISKYAYGRDYHKVLKTKLKRLYTFVRELDESIEGRYFVDSAPVLERDWARRSGLGWMGKNTMIIHPKRGSYFFLSELILNVELPPDDPIQDYCGTCTRCIEACPTDAILDSGYQMDGSKCISYLTIELKSAIPGKFKGKMENYIFGCDICQEVCPWNRFSTPHDEPDFEPTKELLEMTEQDWKNLTEEEFEELFRGSAVKRAKFSGIKRNIDFCNNQ
ncbi:MAG: tRNA epoxyqueuosine(34) reductase QueG [Saprospiraceae bacterium]|nr:tRNA epoxyqueuosine(34) reductase QueG [Saprospiraceae bacterium]